MDVCALQRGVLIHKILCEYSEDRFQAGKTNRLPALDIMCMYYM